MLYPHKGNYNLHTLHPRPREALAEQCPRQHPPPPRPPKPALQKGLGLMENKMETTIVCRGYIGIMENKMETTIVCRGYVGIMENKTETTIVCRGYIGDKRRRRKGLF